MSEIKLKQDKNGRDRLFFNDRDLDLTFETQDNGNLILKNHSGDESADGRVIDHSQQLGEPMTRQQANELMEILETTLNNYAYPTNLGRVARGEQ